MKRLLIKIIAVFSIIVVVLFSSLYIIANDNSEIFKINKVYENEQLALFLNGGRVEYLDDTLYHTLSGYNCSGNEILTYDSSLKSLKISNFNDSTKCILYFEADINLNCNEDDLVFHYGDVNMDGQITAYDSSLLRQTFAGLIGITSVQRLLSDSNGDGVVNPTDATLINQYIVGTFNSNSIVGNEFNATCGDVDLSNTLSYSDYELLINYISNNYELSNAQIKIADVNNDGVTDENDALTLQYYFQNNN